MDGATPPGWRRMKFAEMLSYEQPGPYLVTTTQQLDAGRVPVLTAGKTFILGYTNDDHGVYTKHPVIIFDDFTTASKFVDFDFKARSSAMKILSGRPGIANVRYLYERMQMISFPIGDHKRHWISEYSQTAIGVPGIVEQNQLGEVISDLTHQVSGLLRLIAKKQGIKQGMMQHLLTGKTRLPGFSDPWNSGPLKQFMPLQRGFDLPNSRVVPGAYPIVYSNGIGGTHNTAMAKGPGVVTGRSGTIGKVHYVDRNFWPHNTALWVTSFSRTDAKFAYYFLTHLGLERFSGGSGVPTLNRNDAHGFEIRLPSDRREQRAIAATLTASDEVIDVVRSRLDKTKAIKQGMMQELLTGRTRLPVEEGAA